MLMKIRTTAFALALTALLAACGSPKATPPAFSSQLTMQPATDFQSILIGNASYRLSAAKSYPLIDSWIYNLPHETGKNWTQRVEVQRYKKVNAKEIFEQMTEATKTQSQQLDVSTHTVCFVTERNNGQLKEANIWRYADTEKGLTYANGLLWQFPAGMAFNTFMKGEFPRTCAAMRTQPLITPPALST